MVTRWLLNSRQAKLLLKRRGQGCELWLIRGNRADSIGREALGDLAPAFINFLDGHPEGSAIRHDDGFEWHSIRNTYTPIHFIFGRQAEGQFIFKFWNGQEGFKVGEVALDENEARQWARQLRSLLEHAGERPTGDDSGPDLSDIESAPFADCLRARDHRAFRQLARQTGCIFILCVPDPLAQSRIGRNGFLPQPPDLVGVTVQSPPNQGLLAADPGNSQLARILDTATPPVTYAQFVDSLKARGYTVASAKDGFVIRDGAGNCFYPAYQLHGVYVAENGRNAWKPAAGLQRAINSRLGADLIQSGPLDQCELLYDAARAGLVSEPRPPALAYEPGGMIRTLLDAAQIRAYYESHNIDWSDLYPELQAAEAGGQ